MQAIIKTYNSMKIFVLLFLFINLYFIALRFLPKRVNYLKRWGAKLLVLCIEMEAKDSRAAEVVYLSDPYFSGMGFLFQ